MNIIKNIIFTILSIQENLLRARLKKTIGIKNTSKRRSIRQNGCFLTLETLAEAEKTRMEEELGLILKQASYEPERLLDFVKSQGTPVYYIDNPNILYSVGENEGFIYPQKGAKALYISSITTKNFKLNTPDMFILSKGKINKFYFIYHFYNWYSFKHGISGMDSESITMLNKYLLNATDEEINKLQLADIYKLKDAIKQDKASIEFVFKLCRDMEGAQKAFGKLKNGGADI